MRARLSVYLLLLSGLTSVRQAAAQCSREGVASMRPGAIVGLITDTANAPLSGVRVVISSPRRDVRTDAAGRFQIDSLDTGKHELALMRIGYQTAVAQVDVRAEGGSARICMGVQPRRLAPVVTSVFRGGLSGRVSDSTNQVVPGAEVRTLATRSITTTDSTGSFFLDLDKGSYVLQVYRKGYARQIVSVTIPKDSGREVVVWLSAADGRENGKAQELSDLRERMMKATGFRNALLTRDFLASTGFDLVGAVSAQLMHPVDERCDVHIGGEPNIVMPLWTLDKDEIELLEINRGSAESSRGPKSINSRGGKTLKPGTATRSPVPADRNCAQLQLVAWLRK